MRRGVAIAVLGLGLAVGVYALREETMSVHVTNPPDSWTSVVVDATTNRAEPSATEAELTEALILTCRLQVAAELRPPRIVEVAGHAYGFELTPALDESDTRQLRGCLTDMRVDHLQLDVVSLRHHGT